MGFIVGTENTIIEWLIISFFDHLDQLVICTLIILICSTLLCRATTWAMEAGRSSQTFATGKQCYWIELNILCWWLDSGNVHKMAFTIILKGNCLGSNLMYWSKLTTDWWACGLEAAVTVTTTMEPGLEGSMSTRIAPIGEERQHFHLLASSCLHLMKHENISISNQNQIPPKYQIKTPRKALFVGCIPKLPKTLT